MIYAAHAAAPAPGLAPNSREALERVLTTDCRWLEVDVLPRGDELILAHDEQSIPAEPLTLDEALRLAHRANGPETTLQLDYKGNDAKLLIKVLRPHVDQGWNFTLSSFLPQVLKDLMAEFPELSYVYNLGWRNALRCGSLKVIRSFPKPIVHVSVRRDVAPLLWPWLLVKHTNFFIYTLYAREAIWLWQLFGATGCYIEDYRLVGRPLNKEAS